MQKKYPVVTIAAIIFIFLSFIPLLLIFQFNKNKPDLVRESGPTPSVTTAPEDELPPTSKPTPENEATVKDGCVISGCSSEICSESEMFSTCVLKPEYECYKGATCEKQKNGKCAWTETTGLKTCLSKF